MHPQEKQCIFDVAFLADDQRTRVISAAAVAGCSFPAARQIMVAHNYRLERKYQEQIQREDQRFGGRTLEFSSIGK